MRALHRAKTKKTDGRGASLRFNSTGFLTDGNSGLYVEDYFNEIIYMERLRAERSGRPFLLALIDIKGLHNEARLIEMHKEMGEAFCTSTRETDIKGWYIHGAIMGVIFTELDAADTTAVRGKLATALASCAHVTPQILDKIRLTFHLYPDTDKSTRAGIAPDLKLYPELTKKKPFQRSSLRYKRTLDIAGSLIAVVLFLPFFIVIPILIKATSRGPVLYRQKRVGEQGRTFTFLKFRSMRDGSDDTIHSDYIRKLILEEKAYDEDAGGKNGRVYKIKDDPRMTRVGKWLRRTSLDELPQFFNVIKGDMSLVGPRPPIGYELENYARWHWRRVLQAKPGITGLWQVKGRSVTTFNDMVRMDIRYIGSASFWLDVKLILLTPWSMLMSRGAY